MGLLRSPTVTFGILLIVAFALLYGLTLDNGLRPDELAGGDLITHQYAQVQARLSNAPGYPLYTLGGWLWFHTGRLLFGPDANPIRILSSYSTFWALVALGLLYMLVLEAVGSGVKPTPVVWGGARDSGESLPPAHGGLLRAQEDGTRAAWPIALFATAFYGVTYFFWYYAVTSEQYTSSVAWTLAAILLAFRWERSGRDRYLLGLALLAGIGLAHQITVLAVIPPILWLVLSREPGVLRRGWLMASMLGLMLLPLLSYAFVYIRGAQHPEWRGAGEWASTWHWFWSFLSTSQGRSELTWSLRPFLTAEFPALMWRELTVPGLIIGLLGWSALGRRRGVLLYATFAIYLVLCWVDRLGNWYQVIMPIYALLAVGIAAAAVHVERSFKWPAIGGGLAVRRAAVLITLLALIVYRGVASYPRANAANQAGDTGLAPAWAILADNPPPGTAVLATYPESLALSYVTQIWGRRPDLVILTAEEAQARGATTGFAVTEAALPLVPAAVTPAAHFSALGRTLVSVRPVASQDVPAGMAAWAHDFGGQVRLVAGKLQQNQATGEQVVLLAWQAPANLQDDWSVSVRLIQGDADVAQCDRQTPVFGAYPMTRWAVGETVVDAYPFVLAPATEVDAVRVLLYRRADDGGFTNLGEARFPIDRE